MNLIQDVLFGLNQVQMIQAMFTLENIANNEESDYREKSTVRMVLFHIRHSRRLAQKISNDPNYVRSITYPDCVDMERQIRRFMDHENLLVVDPCGDFDRQVMARVAALKILAYALAKSYPRSRRAYEQTRSAA